VAHSLSSKKRIRQNVTRRALNRSRRGSLKSTLRRCNDLLLHGSTADTERSVRDAIKLLDREASRGLIHRNAAARRKSRLAQRLQTMQQKAEA